MMGKKFLVELGDSKLEWKVENEQREILGYQCMKATTMRDSMPVTAWFTLQIPLPIGPGNYRGLPGAVLAVDLPREQGAMTIAATEVKLGKLKKAIEQPKKGQRVSEEKFDELVEQHMKEMRDMHGGEGGGTFIKIEVDED